MDDTEFAPPTQGLLELGEGQQGWPDDSADSDANETGQAIKQIKALLVEPEGYSVGVRTNPLAPVVTRPSKGPPQATDGDLHTSLDLSDRPAFNNFDSSDAQQANPSSDSSEAATPTSHRRISARKSMIDILESATFQDQDVNFDPTNDLWTDDAHLNPFFDDSFIGTSLPGADIGGVFEDGGSDEQDWTPNPMLAISSDPEECTVPGRRGCGFMGFAKLSRSVALKRRCSLQRRRSRSGAVADEPESIAAQAGSLDGLSSEHSTDDEQGNATTAREAPARLSAKINSKHSMAPRRYSSILYPEDFDQIVASTLLGKKSVDVLNSPKNVAARRSKVTFGDEMDSPAQRTLEIHSKWRNAKRRVTIKTVDFDQHWVRRNSSFGRDDNVEPIFHGRGSLFERSRTKKMELEQQLGDADDEMDGGSGASTTALELSADHQNQLTANSVGETSGAQPRSEARQKPPPPPPRSSVAQPPPPPPRKPESKPPPPPPPTSESKPPPPPPPSVKQHLPPPPPPDIRQRPSPPPPPVTTKESPPPRSCEGATDKATSLLDKQKKWNASHLTGGEPSVSVDNKGTKPPPPPPSKTVSPGVAASQGATTLAIDDRAEADVVAAKAMTSSVQMNSGATSLSSRGKRDAVDETQDASTQRSQVVLTTQGPNTIARRLRGHFFKGGKPDPVQAKVSIMESAVVRDYLKPPPQICLVPGELEAQPESEPKSESETRGRTNATSLTSSVHMVETSPSEPQKSTGGVPTMSLLGVPPQPSWLNPSARRSPDSGLKTASPGPPAPSYNMMGLPTQPSWQAPPPSTADIATKSTAQGPSCPTYSMIGVPSQRNWQAPPPSTASSSEVPVLEQKTGVSAHSSQPQPCIVGMASQPSNHGKLVNTSKATLAADPKPIQPRVSMMGVPPQPSWLVNAPKAPPGKKLPTAAPKYSMMGFPAQPSWYSNASSSPRHVPAGSVGNSMGQDEDAGPSEESGTERPDRAKSEERRPRSGVLGSDPSSKDAPFVQTPQPVKFNDDSAITVPKPSPVRLHSTQGISTIKAPSQPRAGMMGMPTQHSWMVNSPKVLVTPSSGLAKPSQPKVSMMGMPSQPSWLATSSNRISAQAPKAPSTPTASLMGVPAQQSWYMNSPKPSPFSNTTSTSSSASTPNATIMGLSNMPKSTDSQSPNSAVTEVAEEVAEMLREEESA